MAVRYPIPLWQPQVVACATIVLSALGYALICLRAVSHFPVEEIRRSASPAALAYRLAVASLMTFVLTQSYRDPNALKLVHKGRVAYVKHAARFCTFTLWCNVTSTLYFWASALATMTLLSGAQLAVPMAALVMLLWEVAFPLSWLVSLVVSFVLIPVGRRTDPERVEVLLRWRPQVLHNGYLITCVLEFALAAPPMAWNHWPCMFIFGSAYLIFAWCMYARIGVYAYFFLDPTVKWAPLSYSMLLVLTTCLFALAAQLTAFYHEASMPITIAVGIVITALCTCTWR